MKKLLSVIMILVLLLGAIPAQADTAWASVNRKNKSIPLREAADKKSAELAQLPHGTIVKVLEKGTWAHVEYEGLQGYVTGKYLKYNAKAPVSVVVQEAFAQKPYTLNLAEGDLLTTPVTVPLSGVSKAGRVTVNGLFVDESYKDKTSDVLRKVYMSYTVCDPDNNIFIGTNDITMTINGKNSFTTKIAKYDTRYMGTHHCENETIQIYAGEKQNFVHVFVVPRGELAPGRELTFVKKTGLPEMSEIKLSTDDLVYCNDIQTIAKIADPEGYKLRSHQLAKASSKDEKKVKKQMNGYYWDFWNSTMSGRIEFSGKKFTLNTKMNGISMGKTGGTYKVLNDFIELTNSSTGAVTYAAITWRNGEMNLDVASAYDFTTYGID